MEKATNYAMRVLIQRILGWLCFLIGAGWVMTWQTWVYFGSGFIVTVVSLIIVYFLNPEVLAERGKVVTDSPKWDKAILATYWLLQFFILYFIAGVEFGTKTVRSSSFWAGMSLSLISAAVATAALAANPYLEPTARVQSDRGQTVVDRGVYGFVRHPTYSAVLVSCVATWLVFGTPVVLGTVALIGILIVFRTFLEDKMLITSLQGYRDYCTKVKYRLIPYVW